MNWFTYYANHGFSVLPVRKDGSKAPAVSAWAQYRIDIADEATLERWHSEGWGVALIGGAVSGGLEVIDIDDPSLVKPFIEAVMEQSPSLVGRVAFVSTPRKDPETGRAGCHVLYRCEHPEGNTKLAMSEPLPVIEDGEHKKNPITSEALYRPETLIETRGEGGYVLTVGSPGECHTSGLTYEHAWGAELGDLTKISDEERAVLHTAARLFDRSVIERHSAPDFGHDNDAPGNRYAKLTSWADILEPHDWRKVGESAGVTRWARPGKDRGWSATTGLTSQNGSELLCVFSSNAHPFEGPTSGRACSTHGKFDCYAKLNFSGDHSAAARHLASEGYGSIKKFTPAKPITMATWENVTHEYIEDIENGGQTVLQTGIPELDDAIGGFGLGEVVIIGGAPSHGKTLLALQFADHTAKRGTSSLLLNEEMSFPMLAKRRLQMASPITEHQWPDNLEELKEDHDEWSAERSPIYLSPPCGDVESAVQAMEWAHENEIRVIVIDYAQLLRGKGNGRYEQVTDVSQRIREATSRFGHLTVLLAQLSRSNRKLGDRPRLTDLRDSGQLEQDCDVGLLIDRPYLRGDTNCECQDFIVYIDKNRNRETTEMKVELKVDLPRQRIVQKPAEDYSWDA